MKPLWKLSAAGFAATAMTFGPARMGFGLFLSEFRSTFSISTGMAGLISSLGFLAFLLGLLAAYALTARRGPRLPVILGLVAAARGMGIVASAPSLPILAVGVFFAMSSAGFSWAPFNNAVHRQVDDELRPGALSMVSTGTSLGVAAAGATALALNLGGISWRIGWAAFAVVSALAALANWAALRDVAGSSGPASNQPWQTLLRAPAIPLYGIALSFGTTTAIYISFAADRIEQAGGVPGLPASASPALLFVSYGVGLVGLTTGRAKAATGLAGLLRLLLLGVDAVSSPRRAGAEVVGGCHCLRRASTHLRDDDERGFGVLVGTAVSRASVPQLHRGAPGRGHRQRARSHGRRVRGGRIRSRIDAHLCGRDFGGGRSASLREGARDLDIKQRSSRVSNGRSGLDRSLGASQNSE